MQMARQRAGGAVERRRHVRIPLEDHFPLLMRVEQEGATFIAVRARDLSSSGLGFFHVAYMHPGTNATFIMKGLRGEVATVKGTITRCSHVSGRVHEVGAVFERGIRVEVFVSADTPDMVTPMEDVYRQIGTMAEQIRKLAADRAELDQIQERLGKMALLVSPPAGAPAPSAPGPAPDAGRIPAARA
jgi:hypothetical protein